MSWATARLRDLPIEIIDGDRSAKYPKVSEFVSEGVAFLNSTNIDSNGLNLSEVNFVTEEKFSTITKGRFRDSDILMTTRGSIGKVARVSRGLRGLINAQMLILRPDEAKVDSRYLFAVMRSTDMQEKLRNFSSGSAQPQIPIRDLREIEVQLPTVVMQRRIASILSAYDDLIENNTRRIAILEEMARRIYEEWFVRFRFPGHENVRMVESELGQVPEGWKHYPLGALVEHHIGGGWGQEEANNEFSVPAYVIRGTDIPDVRGGSLGRAPLRFHTPSNFRSRELKARDIVFEVSGGSKDQPVGRAVMVPATLLSRTGDPVICASFCRLVRADASQILPELLHLHFERIYANREIMQYQTQSTGITNFKFTVFLEKEMILKPSAEVQERFTEVLLPMLGLVERLGIKNSNLRTTRDLLLPKLISGELDVSAIPEPEAAAA